MKKNRLIAVVLLKDGWIVQSKGFSRYQNIGNPHAAVKRLSEWGCDEVIYLDISKGGQYDIRREDQGYKNRNNIVDILDDVSKVTFMPITVGGKIRTLDDIEKRLSLGADKVAINKIAVESPLFVNNVAKEFGSQCVVVSLDVKKIGNEYLIHTDSGTVNSNISIFEYVKIMSDMGAGELLINSIDRDGQGLGYDIDLMREAADLVNIPIIACGGAGEYSHFEDALKLTKVDAVAAANIFHYRDQSVFLARKHLIESKCNVRKPNLIKI